MFKTQAKYGNPFETIKLRVTNRSGSAVTVGNLMSFDQTASLQSETSSGDTPYDTAVLALEDSLWANIINPITPAVNIGHAYCVVTDLLDGAGADNTEVEVTLQGVVSVDAASATYTVGQLVSATGTDSAREVIAMADTAGYHPIGKVIVGGSSVETLTVMFFGWSGLVGTGGPS